MLARKGLSEANKQHVNGDLEDELTALKREVRWGRGRVRVQLGHQKWEAHPRERKEHV